MQTDTRDNISLYVRLLTPVAQNGITCITFGTKKNHLDKFRPILYYVLESPGT